MSGQYNRIFTTNRDGLEWQRKWTTVSLAIMSCERFSFSFMFNIHINVIFISHLIPR